MRDVSLFPGSAWAHTASEAPASYWRTADGERHSAGAFQGEALERGKQDAYPTIPHVPG